MNVARSRVNKSGEETRARIIDAALKTIRTEGIVGTTARSIARAGEFNQALIFYHFGSIADLLMASVAELTNRRVDAYRGRIAHVTTLDELVRVGRDLYAADLASGQIAILTQLFAAAQTEPALAAQLLEQLEPWHAVIGEAIDNVIGGTALAVVLPRDDVVFAITALFLGIQLTSQLDPESGNAERLFGVAERLAGLGTQLLGGPRPAA